MKAHQFLTIGLSLLPGSHAAAVIAPSSPVSTSPPNLNPYVPQANSIRPRWDRSIVDFFKVAGDKTQDILHKRDDAWKYADGAKESFDFMMDELMTSIRELRGRMDDTSLDPMPEDQQDDVDGWMGKMDDAIKKIEEYAHQADEAGDKFRSLARLERRDVRESGTASFAEYMARREEALAESHAAEANMFGAGAIYRGGAGGTGGSSSGGSSSGGSSSGGSSSGGSS